jgi:spore germination cell wall hydrolase CwlJ-like protein
MLAATCLALAIYYEAGTEPPIAKMATGWAIVNSMELSHHHNNVCREVFSGRYMGMRVFKRKGVPPNNRNWRESQLVAKGILKHELVDPTHGATNFECTDPKACRVLPSWAVGMEYRGQFGHQFFFKRSR